MGQSQISIPTDIYELLRKVKVEKNYPSFGALLAAMLREVGEKLPAMAMMQGRGRPASQALLLCNCRECGRGHSDIFGAPIRHYGKTWKRHFPELCNVCSGLKHSQITEGVHLSYAGSIALRKATREELEKWANEEDLMALERGQLRVSTNRVEKKPDPNPDKLLSELRRIAKEGSAHSSNGDAPRSGESVNGT